MTEKERAVSASNLLMPYCPYIAIDRTNTRRSLTRGEKFQSILLSMFVCIPLYYGTYADIRGSRESCFNPTSTLAGKRPVDHPCVPLLPFRWRPILLHVSRPKISSLGLQRQVSSNRPKSTITFTQLSKLVSLLLGSTRDRAAPVSNPGHALCSTDNSYLPRLQEIRADHPCPYFFIRGSTSPFVYSCFLIQPNLVLTTVCMKVWPIKIVLTMSESQDE